MPTAAARSIAPLGIALAGPTYGEAMVYAELEAWMIKATKAIVDTMGHYARPDVLRLLVRREQGWVQAGAARDLSPLRAVLNDDALKRAADARDVDPTRWSRWPRACAAPRSGSR